LVLALIGGLSCRQKVKGKMWKQAFRDVKTAFGLAKKPVKL
jgi:hypothetical protein